MFAWTTPLDTANLSWVLLVAAFIAVLTGAINWLVGFATPAKERRPSTLERIRETPAARRNRSPGSSTARSRH
jgi:cytoskeletal protein RodZ